MNVKWCTDELVVDTKQLLKNTTDMAHVVNTTGMAHVVNTTGMAHVVNTTGMAHVVNLSHKLLKIV